MFGRNGGAKSAVADTMEYVDPLVKDEKLRRRVAAAVVAAAVARQRVRRQTGPVGLARRLSSDPVLRAQLIELGTQLRGAQHRAHKVRSHRLRNTLLFAAGVGLTVAAVPAARAKVLGILRRDDDWSSAPKQAAIEETIEVDVPLSTAYNQWTQFEEFPRFMDGVDEVRQLDDTLLHWAATVAGKHVEWEAKIVQQEPDRRIAWVSTDGKQTRGTVTFEEAGPARSRISLELVYTPEGAAEKVGSTIGLDRRRVRGDLERFRELVEAQGAETGAWRGEIHAGVETRADV